MTDAGSKRDVNPEPEVERVEGDAIAEGPVREE